MEEEENETKSMTISEDSFNKTLENSELFKSLTSFKDYEFQNRDINKDVDIFIKVNKSHYLQNETCIGFIKFYIKKSYVMEDITIQLWQEENYNMANEECKNRIFLTETQIKIEEFFKDQKKITLEKGEYMFPFNFNIPEKTVPYFNYTDPAIISVVKTEVLAIDKNKKPLCKPCELKVKTIIPKETKENLTAEKNKDVKKWGFFKAGSVDVKLELNQNCFSTGDIAEVKYVINNTKGNMTINKVKTSLYRLITYKDNDGNKALAREQKLTGTFNEVSCPPGQTINGLCYLEMADSMVFYSDEKMKPKNHTLQPSVDTKLIKCEYYFKMTAKTDTYITKDYKPRCTLSTRILN